MPIKIPGDNPLLDLGQSQTATLASLAYAKETYLQMHPQWDNAWTQSDTYVEVTGSLNAIDFADWPFHNWYFEMIGKVDGGTGSYKLLNNDTSSDITGSEITTTSTTPVRIRSGTLTKPTGIVNIRIHHKQTGGGAGDFVNSIMSRTVFRTS